MLGLPGNEIVMSFDDFNIASEHAIHARQISLRRLPGLSFSNESHSAGRNPLQLVIRALEDELVEIEFWNSTTIPKVGYRLLKFGWVGSSTKPVGVRFSPQRHHDWMIP